MANQLIIMIIAVITAAAVMIFASGPIGHFVEEHPTIKMLALSFLLLIGFTLIVEGLHQHIPKGYIYFAMGFSIFVELLNLRLRARAAHPVNLREPYVAERSLMPAPVAVESRAEQRPGARKAKPKGKKRR
jgi:predicted tellurium resistance membrane protein TerC